MENNPKSLTRVCSRCGTQVELSPSKSVTKGYSAYCPEHDEDLYLFETEEPLNLNLLQEI